MSGYIGVNTNGNETEII